MDTDQYRHQCERFRMLHRRGEPLLLPNAWDFASAAILAGAGYPAIGTTSLGVAVAAGHPDASGATAPHTLELTRSVRRLGCLLTVDIEAGFASTAEAVAEVCAELAAAGAVGINIEDGRGDHLAPAGEQVARITAIKERVPDLFVNARTDTYWVAGGTDDPGRETLRRAEAYQAAGADGIFVPGLKDPGLIETLAAADRPPLNLLFTPGAPTRPQLADLGVARVSTGSLLFRAALHATVTVAAAIRADDPEAGTGLPSYAEADGLSSESSSAKH